NAHPRGARALPGARSRNPTGRHRGPGRAAEACELVFPRQGPPPSRHGRVPRGVPSRLGCHPLAPGAHGLGARESATLPERHVRRAPRRPAFVRRAGGEPRLNRLLQLALRAIYGRYVPEPVKNSLRLQLMLLRRDVEPARANPPRGRLAVVAPPTYDEVFGGGATIAPAADAGARIPFVYVTDGSKGYPGARLESPADAEVGAFEATLVARRKEEAHLAAGVLG